MRVTFKIPAHEGKGKAQRRVEIDATGQLFSLSVGGVKIRCVLQDNGALAHWASGFVISQSGVQAVKLECMARLSSYTRTSDRRAAEIALSRIVDRIGAEKVLAAMEAQTVINTKVQRAPAVPKIKVV